MTDNYGNPIILEEVNKRRAALYLKNDIQIVKEIYNWCIAEEKKMLENKRVKFNVMTLKYVKNKKSRYGRYFTHENCDVCNKQGVNFEILKYTGLFNPNLITRAIPYRDVDKAGLTGFIIAHVRNYAELYYILYYTCSPDCNTLLALKEEGC